MGGSLEAAKYARRITTSTSSTSWIYQVDLRCLIRSNWMLFAYKVLGLMTTLLFQHYTIGMEAYNHASPELFMITTTDRIAKDM